MSIEIKKDTRKSIRVNLEDIQMKMIVTLMAYYRANGISHTIRLAIEDAHKKMKGE